METRGPVRTETFVKQHERVGERRKRKGKEYLKSVFEERFPEDERKTKNIKVQTARCAL